ncbi:sugar transferase [Limimaricola pyoseonensis]|uniref:Sugar transferase involved in LPS biosynthesis (Colanic, teichoic acid) n=1 Tax=Limimaricola pyoseonensis TaxID=521013 RepID=A0A1G7KKS5_9RHOB|nr:sugar transferase [Limimaricola pyoseonensis]SDF37843.1 Sugar transferase involved in LPS biosynthesis (colanic, teichoic acid) [Limimaricola pyoseonensis]
MTETAVSSDYLTADSRDPKKPALFQTHGRPGKRLFDVAVCLLLLPVLLVAALLLLILNPFFNRGPLFYVQTRMGYGCEPFQAFKFRSMTKAAEIDRGPFDALETNRITRLGRILRKSRVDELPQILNVFAGQMSLIGPRPDFYDHAIVYVGSVRGYRRRHDVLPGISGFAQTEVGYVDGLEGLRRKVAADLLYIRRASMRFDLWLTWQTLRTVVGRRGA